MVKLFVGNLSDSIDSHRLKNLFLQYTNVMECDVLKNFAFVVSLFYVFFGSDRFSENENVENCRITFDISNTFKWAVLKPQSRHILCGYLNLTF
jgi:hypothetical protein